METLEELECVTDTETSSKASQFAKSIVTGQFIVSLVFVSTIFSYMLSLCETYSLPAVI